MTDTVTPSGRGRTGRRLWPVVVLLIALGGCASVVGTLGTLSSDGFSSPNVTISSGRSGATVAISSSRHATLPDDAAVARAAELVWRTTPVRVDLVQASVGSSSGEYRRDQLSALFGPRDPALDVHTLTDEFARTLSWVAVGLVLLLIVGAVVVVLLVRRSRRRWARYPGSTAPR